MIAAIILAAGGSERMGMPKAGLQYRGRSFLEHIEHVAVAIGLSPVIAVVGPDSDKYLPQIHLQSLVVRNDDVQSGPIASLSAGIRAAFDRTVEAAVVWHVDRPHVAPSTITALAVRYREGGASIVVPSHRGRRGHPILIGRAVWDEVLVQPNDGLRTVIRSAPGRVAAVRVDDPAVLEDVDTPEDYQNLLRRDAGAL